MADNLQDPVNAQENHDNELEQKLASCGQELAEWRERCLRTAADFENYKRRAEKERLATFQMAQASILLDVINMVDDFDRAFASLDQKDGNELKQWLHGFQLIYQALLKLLAKYGVEEMKEYITFDPEKHEAVLYIESPEHPSGNVVQVLQKGYLLKNQPLRPAKVSVAK